MRAVLLAAIASIGLVGCVGNLDTTNTGDDDDGGGSGSGMLPPNSGKAKMMFDDNVYGILQAKCVACHSAAGPVGNLSGFVHPDKAKAWETVNSVTAAVGGWASTTAPILGKVNVTGGHQGQSYTMDEINKITDWLNEEVIWRNGGGGSGSGSGSGSATETPAQASQRVLAAWSACMTKTNFDATPAMATAWGQLAAQNNQRCQNCHASGDGGFIASQTSQIFFDVISTNKYYMLQYFSVKLDLTDLTKSAVEINTKSFAGVGTGTAPHQEHPRFNPTTNQGMTALQAFYDKTMAALTAAGPAGCGPSKLTN